MTQKLNVCVVGGGAMGQAHARIWQSLPETQVESIVDVNVELARQVAAELSIPHYFAAYQEALGQGNIDIVSVCLPTFLHPEVTILAAQQGIHVLCEKPIALTLAAGQSMIEATEVAGVKLAIGLMRRYSPVMALLGDFLREERQPVIYRVESALPIRPKRAMHDQQANGGPFIDMLCHFIDTWRAIFQSEPIQVMAQGLTLSQLRPEIEHIAHKAIDSGSFTVQFASGDIGCGFITWGLPPKSAHAPALKENIYGAHGLLDVHFGRPQHVIWHAENDTSTTLISTREDNYRLEIAAFIHSILNDTPLQATGADGLAALQVSLALLESIRSGQAVWL